MFDDIAWSGYADTASVVSNSNSFSCWKAVSVSGDHVNVFYLFDPQEGSQCEMYGAT